MAKKATAKPIAKRSDWVANFALIGEAKINEDYTFKMDAKSEKSSYIYNSMNLGIDCGKEHGVVYVELMGGYFDEGESVLYAHGKKDNGGDDFEKRIEVAWDDRFDEDILESIGDLSFLTVGIEKTDKGKTFYKKFLSAYDAIEYIQKHLKEGMVLNVKGNLKYGLYNDNTQVRKQVTSIVLSKVEDPKDYKATIKQTILIDSDSIDTKRVDKEKGTIIVSSKVLDYLKDYDGKEFKGQYPFPKDFEFLLPTIKPKEGEEENTKPQIDKEVWKKIYEKVFKVKKGYTQITFKGDIVEGGAITTATEEDLTDDVKELIDAGVYTLEEALKECSTSGSREQRMILTKVDIKMVGEEKKVPVVQKFEEKYTDDELYGWMSDWKDADGDELPFGNDDDKTEETEQDSDDDWLDSL